MKKRAQDRSTTTGKIVKGKKSAGANEWNEAEAHDDDDEESSSEDGGGEDDDGDYDDDDRPQYPLRTKK